MFKRKFKKIEPGSGLGKLQFGLEKEKILEIIGEPNKKYKEVFEGTRLVEVWDYDELGLSLKFDGVEVLELSSMSIISSYYKYNGTSIIGKTFEQVAKVLKDEAYLKIIPEGITDIKLLYAVDLNLIVWFEKDVATSLSWDVSDVDVYLLGSFTEQQKEDVRKKITDYREAREEAILQEEIEFLEKEKRNKESVRSNKDKSKSADKRNSNKNKRKKKKIKFLFHEGDILDFGVLLRNFLNLAVMIYSTIMAFVGNTALFAPIAIIFGAMFFYFNDKDYTEYRVQKKRKQKKKNQKTVMKIHNKILLGIVIFFAFCTLVNRATDLFATFYGLFIFSAVLFIISFVLRDWKKE